MANSNDMKFRPKLINDKLTNQKLLMDPVITVKSSKIWLKKSIKSNFLPLTVVDHKGNNYGMTGLTQVDFYNKRAQFYITLNEKIRGLGLSSIIIKRVINFAKKNKLKKIYLFTLTKNKHGEKIFKKNLFKFEAFLKNHFYKNKKFINVKLFSLFI